MHRRLATFAVKLNLGKEDDLLSAYAWIVIVAIIDYIIDRNLVYLPFLIDSQFLTRSFLYLDGSRPRLVVYYSIDIHGDDDDDDINDISTHPQFVATHILPHSSALVLAPEEDQPPP